MMILRLAMATLIAALVVSAEDIPDGIYYWAAEGDGRRVPRHDGRGGEVVLGELVAEKFGTVTITSIANDNSLFGVNVVGGGPGLSSRTPDGRYFAFCVAGLVMPFQGSRGGAAHARLAGLDNARRVAEALNLKLKLRKHSGHRYVVGWTPSKPSYRPGEPVMLKMEIRNVGEVAFAFRDGGMNRGPRNNQFSFTAYRERGHGEAIPDTGDPANFGGLAGPVTINPGESCAKDVKLNDWFKFTEADTYRITGIYRIGIRETDTIVDPIWDDFAVGECLVHIEKD